MGIHQFHTWLKETYPNCVQLRNNRKYNHIYIDLNFMLHLSIYKSNNERSFLMNLYNSLDNIIGSYLALESITIAIDGPSPYSKINLQRKRRLQMASNADVSSLNSLHLTPGTKFMINLTNHITNYVNTRKKWFKYRKVTFHTFPTTLPGEGEIKLLEKLIENGNKNPYASHLIVGNDADLVVIGMSVINIHKIDVLIKTKTKYDMVQVDTLIKEVASNVGCIKNPNIEIVKKLPLRQDFAVLSVMMGNDYLPKLSCGKFDKLWESYKKTRNNTGRFLTKECSFDIIFFKEFLENVISTLSKQYQTLDLRKYIQYGEENIKNYLEGILWCLKMYSSGLCPMYDYECFCQRSPSPVFILYYLAKNNYDLQIPISNVKPLTVYTCAILLLPKKAQYLLPDKYHDLIENELKPCYEMEECDMCQKFKNKIKSLSETIHNLRNSDKSSIHESNQIKRYHNEYNTHKNIHNNDFTIDKIRNIVEKYDNVSPTST